MSEEHNKKQLEVMQSLVELAKERTKMSSVRSEMSAQRTYMNTERTLSVWIRTALSVMIFGIAIDRFGLLFGDLHHTKIDFLFINGTPSSITGAILVIFSMFMAGSAALRFIGFARCFKKEHIFPSHHKPMLPVVYAFMIIIFGIVLLLVMMMQAEIYMN